MNYYLFKQINTVALNFFAHKNINLLFYHSIFHLIDFSL